MGNFDVQLKKDAVGFKNIENIVERKLGDLEGFTITKEPRGLVLRFKDAIIFDSGSDVIKKESKNTLDKLAVILKDVPYSIRVEGYTDNTPINTKKFPSNWELSTSRATNIVRYLINNHQINPNKLSAVGYGEYLPLNSNLSESERAANRRVDIVLLSTASKIFEPSINKMKVE